MSASFFDTILTCDARTDPDDARAAQFAIAGTQQPRWTATRESHAWASVHVYAETAVHIAAQAIADTPMDGITGDHPDKRLHAVTILDAAADLVRLLALDADGDGALTEERWRQALRTVSDAVAVPIPDTQGLRHTRMRILQG